MGVDPSVAMTMGLGDQTMYLTAPGYGYDAGMQGGYAQQGMMQQGMGMQPGMMPQGYQGY